MAKKRPALLRRLKQVRRPRYEKRASQHVGRVTDLSAPIPDHSDRPFAAITVPFFAKFQQTQPVELELEKLVHTAANLSSQLKSNTPKFATAGSLSC